MTEQIWATRPATEDDLPTIARTIERCGMLNADEVAEFTSSIPDTLRDPGAIWQITDGLDGAAYATRDGMSEDVWNMWFLGVAADDHGKGAGAALLVAMEGAVKAEGARILIIETSSDDAMIPARGLYASRGYTEQGRIAHYYQEGEAKVIFAKHLP
ncbi:MAG: GNAT family N-acetyltransferase [Shimia sp.]